MSDSSDRHAWWTYIAASLQGWVVAAAAVVLLHRFADLPALAGVALVVAWIAADLIKFPKMRRYYTSEPATRGMVGQKGVVVTALEPEGRVRVRGELWQARAEDPSASIPEGAAVRVAAVHGLQLTVSRTEPFISPGSPPPPKATSASPPPRPRSSP